MNNTPNEQQLEELIEAQAQGELITAVPTDPIPPIDTELDARSSKLGGGEGGWPGF
jgi:hypothetical protein